MERAREREREREGGGIILVFVCYFLSTICSLFFIKKIKCVADVCGCLVVYVCVRAHVCMYL